MNKERARPVRIIELKIIFESMAAAATFIGAESGHVRDAMRGYRLRTDRPNGRTAYKSAQGFTFCYETKDAYENQVTSLVKFVERIKKHARGRRLYINDSLFDILGVTREEFWGYMIERAVYEHADLQMLNKNGAISVEWKAGRLAA